MGYSSSHFKTFLFGEEVKLIDPRVPETEIKADFDAHIFEKWSRESIKAQIMEYSRNTLVYLNEYLYAMEQGMEFSLDTKNDIEHIMPNSGKNASEIRRDAHIEDGVEFDMFVNKLGNKILLEEKINRSIGNEWFRTKVSTHLGQKTGYIDSAFPMARGLVSRYRNEHKPYWMKEDIEQATEEAAERIVNFIFG